MRMWWKIFCACVAIAAGGVFASDDFTPMSLVTLQAGSTWYTEVRTLGSTVKGCYLKPPTGTTVQFLPEDLSYGFGNKFELNDPLPFISDCRAIIHNLDENDNGIWELYFTTEDGAKGGSQYYNLEVSTASQDSSASGNPTNEEVKAVPSAVTVVVGSDLFVRLENPTSLSDTCVLVGPVRNTADRDEKIVDTCGFIVRNVNLADTGTWVIEYGTETKYRAPIQVTVIERFQSQENNVLVWTKNMPLNVTVGPEDAVYCRVENPAGLILVDGFGRCNIVLDRVRSEHAGVWKMHVGTVGKVLVVTYQFTVTVETASKAEVITSVVSQKPFVMLSCRVEGEREVSACKFRDPSGKVLLASQGVGEDRYSFHGTEVDVQSEVNSTVCGLRITNPVVGDLGLWRCAVETKDDTYYGFLTVLCPFAMRDPNVAAAVVSEPTLIAETQSIQAVEGDTVTMRCSVQSAIRYCYFRARNGTVFNVNPGSSDGFEYAGAGLDSGECSIRFPSLQARDSGSWSCHVGFQDLSKSEQRVQIDVQIEDEMVADQYHKEDDFRILVIRAQMHSRSTLEYCRFVQINGEGFTLNNLPSGYEDYSNLASGLCEIRIRDANILERHPWTVVARIVGHDSELTRSTQHTLSMPEEQPVGPDNHGRGDSRFMVVWSCVLVLALVLFVVGMMLGPKRNRDWTVRRANNLRSSITKKPLTAEQNAQDPRTPMPA